jgi:hypothetical protein
MIEWCEIRENPPEINEQTHVSEQLLVSDGEHCCVGVFGKDFDDRIIPGWGINIKPKFWAKINKPAINTIDDKTRRELEHILFNEFKTNGECVVNLPVLQKLWDSEWSIRQYRDLFKLMQMSGSGVLIKAVISKEQAEEIIKMFSLTVTSNEIMPYAFAWR